MADGVHRRGDRGGRPAALLLQPLEVEVEQVDPSDRAVAVPLVVGSAEAAGGAVVPVGHEARLVVLAVHVRHRLEEAVPLVLAGALRRQGRVDLRRPDRSRGRSCTRDVLVVDVERVERLRSQRGGLEEGLRVLHLAVGQATEEELVEHVLAVARALLRDRHRAPVDRAVALDRAVHGGQEAHRVAVQGAGVEVAHVPALALVEVLLRAAAAERLGVLVDDVAARRGQRGREARGAPDQQVPGERCRGRAAPVQPGACMSISGRGPGRSS